MGEGGTINFVAVAASGLIITVGIIIIGVVSISKKE